MKNGRNTALAQFWMEHGYCARASSFEITVGQKSV